MTLSEALAATGRAFQRISSRTGEILTVEQTGQRWKLASFTQALGIPPSKPKEIGTFAGLRALSEALREYDAHDAKWQPDLGATPEE